MKIIGIKINNGDASVIKNLKSGWFPFGDFSEPTEENQWEFGGSKCIIEEKVLSKLYWSVSSMGLSNDINISVQCIVGKNGSGKSTLLDVLYSIINNFAYWCLTRSWVEWDNMPKDVQIDRVYGLDAELFFETDGKLQIMHNHDKGFSYYQVKYGRRTLIYNEKKRKIDSLFLKDICSSLFYTISNNYSIYSLNPMDYKCDVVVDKKIMKNTNGNWLEGIFHKNDGYLTPLVIVPFRDSNGNIDRVNEEWLAKQRLCTLAVLFESQGQSFLENYHPEKIVYYFDHDANTFYNNKVKEVIESDKAIDWMLMCFRDKNGKLYNIKNQDIRNSIKNILRKLGGSIYGNIKKEWRQFLVDNSIRYPQYEKMSGILKDTIITYLTYKTIKICITYPSYGTRLAVASPIQIRETQQKGYITSNIRKIIKDIQQEKCRSLIEYITSQKHSNHITLKIRQCLCYIQRGYYSTAKGNKKTVCYFGNENEDSFLRENQRIDSALIGGNAPSQKGYQNYEDVFLRMPPAFFVWEMYFKKKDNTIKEKIKARESLTTLNRMSSGERQNLVSSSYLLYHLTNLQSVRDDRFRVHYKHVNLVFDEVELYFHPEYQRRYLSNLIQTLSQCHLQSEKIQSINIILVTHSPFVLSDIPLSHTLYIEDGQAKARHDETFSANIHNLLVNQFFIEKPMGEVAARIIEEIATKNEFSTQEYDFYRFVVNMIGDNYLRNTLSGILKKGQTKDSLLKEKEEISKRLEDIELRLKKLT
jgi:energy-coupling factor transporter ATP-binding protein EcfA2